MQENAFLFTVDDPMELPSKRRSFVLALAVGLPISGALAARLFTRLPASAPPRAPAPARKRASRAPVSILDFGADPTGAKDNAIAAFRRALEASRTIRIPDGAYNFGDVSGGVLCDLSPFGNDLTFECGQNVTFFCRTRTAEVSAFFGLEGNDNFTCGPARFRDDGYDPLVQNHGAIGFQLKGGSSTWGNVTIKSIYAERCTAALEIVGADATNRVRGVIIGTIVANDCYYGFLAADQGDAVRIGQITAYRTYRPYYVYGVTGHRLRILNRDPRKSTGAVNICRGPGGFDTSDISIDYSARDVSVDICHILINHIDLLGGAITQIRVNVDIEGATAYWPVRFVNYTGSGGRETAAPSRNRVSDIVISGSCDARARPVNVVAKYARQGAITFHPGRFLLPAASLQTVFSVATDS